MWITSSCAIVHQLQQTVTSKYVRLQTEIKAHIVPLMLAAGAAERRQLSEALAAIAAADFPAQWPQLLADLVAQLQAQDTQTLVWLHPVTFFAFCGIL